jgi:hypothetical protein
MLLEFEVAELEASWNKERAECQHLERQVADALRDLRHFCGEAAKTQQANDKALQDVQRELGQLAAAANQQELTALLIEPSEAPKERPGRSRSARRKSSPARALIPAGAGNDLHSTIERARARGNRFNVARIEAWLNELEQALKLGLHAMIDRALAGLAAELAR